MVEEQIYNTFIFKRKFVLNFATEIPILHVVNPFEISFWLNHQTVVVSLPTLTYDDAFRLCSRIQTFDTSLYALYVYFVQLAINKMCIIEALIDTWHIFGQIPIEFCNIRRMHSERPSSHNANIDTRYCRFSQRKQTTNTFDSKCPRGGFRKLSKSDFMGPLSIKSFSDVSPQRRRPCWGPIRMQVVPLP